MNSEIQIYSKIELERRKSYTRMILSDDIKDEEEQSFKASELQQGGNKDIEGMFLLNSIS